MNMLVLRALIAAFVAGGILAPPAAGQTPAPSEPPRPTPVRSVLALAALPSVVDAPLHMKLLRVSVPAGQSTSYLGANGFIFGLSGTVTAATGDGSATLRTGEAVFVGAGKRATLRAGGGEPAVFLHFLLLPARDLDGAVEGAPATVTELFRTTEPIPGLKPGPYEFTLTRVTFPLRMPSNPPHYRSGAALYYILSGTGLNTLEGRTETRPTGSRVYEPYGLVHQWGNPGDAPLVILQANISPEGVPVVIMGTPPAR